MRLEYLRNKYEFTQEEIAQKIGIKQPTYCNYEKGKHTPNLETICKIADIYNTSIDLLNRNAIIQESPFCIIFSN